MIYSRWDPATGRYAYFATPERLGLGDDLPVPTLRDASVLGVASTDAGRPMPASATYAGSGAVPVGVISPLSRNGLGLRGLDSEQRNGYLLLGVVGVAALAACYMALK